MDNDKIGYLDNLRFVAICFVIVLHVSFPYVLNLKDGFNRNWIIGNFCDSASRFCVPIFVMLTGALILPKKTHLIEFLRKRFSRIVFPFIFWSLIYIVIQLISLYLNYGINIQLSKIVILNSFKNGSSYHFWYIYMLIGLYLFIPIIGSWIRNASKIEIHYFLIVWLFSSLLNSFDSYRFLPDINILYFSNYIGYLVLGYYLSQNTHSYDFKLIWSFILLLFCVCIIFLGTFYYSKSFSHFDGRFYDYLSLFVIIMSICVFIIFKELSKIDCKSNYIFYSVRNFINKFNYGIYLAHVLILNIIERIGLNNYFETALIDIPLMSILCLFLSAVLVFIINKLPFGSYYSG